MTGALVFLHGVGGAGRAWAFQSANFARANRVVCWDAPGFGGRALLPQPSFAALAEALCRDLDEAGIERATLIGHSFGGMIAQQVVRDWPNRVERLVLCATSAAFGAHDGALQQRFVGARLAPLERGVSMAELAGDIVDSLIGDAPAAEGVALALSCMASVPEATYRAMIELIVTFDLRAALRDIAVPALLVCGQHDATTPPAVMERMAARIDGARFESIAGAGHLAPLERPAAFNRILEHFLNETRQ